MAVWSDEPKRNSYSGTPSPQEDQMTGSDLPRREHGRVKASAATRTLSLPLPQGLTFAHVKGDK
jgi:hypothetical protein